VIPSKSICHSLNNVMIRRVSGQQIQYQTPDIFKTPEKAQVVLLPVENILITPFQFFIYGPDYRKDPVPAPPVQQAPFRELLRFADGQVEKFGYQLPVNLQFADIYLFR